MPGAFNNQVAIFAVFAMAERAVDFQRDHFGKADDAVQRRAQFMAHIGQEQAFATG